MKPFFKNIVLYIFLKYLAFYVFMMFRNNNYTLIRVNELKTFGDLFYYIWIFPYMPVIITILFSVPIYYSFKLKKIYVFLLLIAAVFVAEYFLYTYWASQLDLMNGVYNAIISIILFILFFYRHIVLVYAQWTR